MIDFSTIVSLTIPEGQVAQIDVNGIKKWEASISALYQRVEYIASSAKQYIVTNFIPKENNVYVEYKARCTGGTENMLYGSTDPTTGAMLNVNEYAKKTLYVRYGNFNKSFGKTLTNDHKVYVTPTRAYYDNVSLSSYSPTKHFTTENTSRLHIFSNHTGNNKYTGRLYYFKVWEGEQLVLDLVPCYRKSDSEIGMYDLANGVFYTNGGTGAFTKGEDIDW